MRHPIPILDAEQQQMFFARRYLHLNPPELHIADNFRSQNLSKRLATPIAIPDRNEPHDGPDDTDCTLLVLEAAVSLAEPEFAGDEGPEKVLGGGGHLQGQELGWPARVEVEGECLGGVWRQVPEGGQHQVVPGLQGQLQAAHLPVAEAAAESGAQLQVCLQLGHCQPRH
jgi:hypothetical protein